MRGNQMAIGAVKNVQETVLIRLDHDLARLAADLKIRQHMFVHAVHVIDVVRRVLKVAGELSGLRPDRQHAGGVQTIEAFARPRVVGLRIAGAPVDQVELRIVRAGSPRRSAALRPGVAVLRPGVGTWFARPWDGVAPPQFLAGFRIPTVQEPARGELAAGHP